MRAARYVLQHPGETWLFNYQADPKTLCVYTDTDWAADESVRAVATSKQTSQILEQIGMQLEVTIASDSSAARGISARTGSGKVRHCSIKELWIQEAYRKEEFQLVSVDTSLNWADIGTKSTHVRAPDVVAEAGAASPERGSDKGVGMSHVDERRTPCKPRRGWRRS